MMPHLGAGQKQSRAWWLSLLCQEVPGRRSPRKMTPERIPDVTLHTHGEATRQLAAAARRHDSRKRHSVTRHLTSARQPAAYSSSVHTEEQLNPGKYWRV
jgi:hypothetical protein